MSTTVTLDPDGPRDPAYVLEIAGAAAETLRVLCHLTMAREALTEPAQVYALLGCLATTAFRYQQLLRQADGWLRAERADGRVTVEGGTYKDRPASAADAISDRLEAAARAAVHMQNALDAAAELTSHLGSRAPDGTR